ncbi:hypothetical protein PoB_002329600 [Plakobranchus ocellatus]|uniref:Secreted protein n=1 Tax=Plakobranchus ocellatus TaxID=259542 RepID=A0AAV3ZQK9_9GAST|nr:hypothetical protein PoB_002329600 [Plakobranchus ocellatus]
MSAMAITLMMIMMKMVVFILNCRDVDDDDDDGDDGDDDANEGADGVDGDPQEEYSRPTFTNGITLHAGERKRAVFKYPKRTRRTDVAVTVLYPTTSSPDNLRNKTGLVVRTATVNRIMSGHVVGTPFPLSHRAAGVRPSCKAQRIAPILR